VQRAIQAFGKRVPLKPLRQPRRHWPPVVSMDPLKTLPPLRHCPHSWTSPLRRDGPRRRSHWSPRRRRGRGRLRLARLEGEGPALERHGEAPRGGGGARFGSPGLPDGSIASRGWARAVDGDRAPRQRRREAAGGRGRRCRGGVGARSGGGGGGGGGGRAGGGPGEGREVAGGDDLSLGLGPRVAGVGVGVGVGLCRGERGGSSAAVRGRRRVQPGRGRCCPGGHHGVQISRSLPVVLGLWGLRGFVSRQDGGSGADARQRKWSGSQVKTWAKGWVRPSQGQKGKSGRNKGPVSSGGGGPLAQVGAPAVQRDGGRSGAASRSRLTPGDPGPDPGAGCRWAAGGPLAPAPCAVPRDFSRSAYVSLGTCSSRRNACRSETLMCLARAVPEQLVTRRRRGDGVGRRADTIICPDAPSREKKLGFAAVNKCKQAGVNVLVAVL
jgi:hypothetical protein